MGNAWRRSSAELTAEQAQELAGRYWETKEPKEPKEKLERAFRVRGSDMSRYHGKISTGNQCVNCGGPIYWTSRSGRDQGDEVCGQCGHHLVSKRCACPPCKEEQAYLRAQEEERQAAAEAKAQAEAKRASDEWAATYSDPAYVARVLRHLTEPQRHYLQCLVEVMGTGRLFSREVVAKQAGLAPHHAERWFALFQSKKLLYNHPPEYPGGRSAVDVWEVNPVLLEHPSWLEPHIGPPPPRGQ